MKSTKPRVIFFAIGLLLTLIAIWACGRNTKSSTAPNEQVMLGTGMSGPLLTSVATNQWLTQPSHCSGNWIACDPTLPNGTGAGKNGCAAPTSCVSGLFTGYEVQGALANMSDGSQTYVNEFFAAAPRSTRNAYTFGKNATTVPAVGTLYASSVGNFSTWNFSLNTSGQGQGIVWACPSNGTTAGAGGCTVNWGQGGDRQSNAGYGNLAGNGTITAVPYKGNTMGGVGNAKNDLVVIASYSQIAKQVGQPATGTCGLWSAPCIVDGDCGNSGLTCIDTNPADFPNSGLPCSVGGLCSPTNPGTCGCTGATPQIADAQCPHANDGTASEMTCQPLYTVTFFGAPEILDGPPYSIFTTGASIYGACQSTCNRAFGGSGAFNGAGNTIPGSVPFGGIPALTIFCGTNADCPSPLICDALGGICSPAAPGPTNLYCQDSTPQGLLACGVGTANNNYAGTGYANVSFEIGPAGASGATQDLVASVSTNGGKTYTTSATVSEGSFVDDPTYGAGGADEPTVRVNGPGNGCVPGTAGCTTSPNDPSTLVFVWDNVNASQGLPAGTATAPSANYAANLAYYESGGTLVNYAPPVPTLPDPLAGPYLAEVPVSQSGAFTFTPVPPHCLNGVKCTNSYAFPIEDDINCGGVAGQTATGVGAFSSWPSASQDQRGCGPHGERTCIATGIIAPQPPNPDNPNPYGVCTASGNNATSCCAGSPCIGVASTTVRSSSNGKKLPQATIDVVSTTAFPAAPESILVATNRGQETVTCAGSTSTAFTGCTGGTGTLSTGNAVTTPDTVTGTCGLIPNACLPGGTYAADGVHQTPIATDANPNVAQVAGGDKNTLHFVNLDSCNMGNGLYGNCLPVQQAWQISMAVRHKPPIDGHPVAPRVYLMYAGGQTSNVLNGGAQPSNQSAAGAGYLSNCGSLGCGALDPTAQGDVPFAFSDVFPESETPAMTTKVWYLSVSDNPFHGYASDWKTIVIGKDTDALGNPAWPACLANALNQANNTQSGPATGTDSTTVPSYDGFGNGGNGGHWYRPALAVNPYWTGSVSSLTNGNAGNAPGEIVFALERSAFAATCTLGASGCDQAQYQAAATEYAGIRVVASQWPAATAGQVVDSWASMINAASTTPVQIINPHYTAGVAAYGGSQIIPTTDQGYGHSTGNVEVAGNQFGADIAITEGTGGGIYAAVTFRQQVSINNGGGSALTTIPFIPGVGHDPVDGGHPACTLVQGTGLDGGPLTQCTGYPSAVPDASVLGQVGTISGKTPPLDTCVCQFDPAYGRGDLNDAGEFNPPQSVLTPFVGVACCNYGNQLSDFEIKRVGFGFQVGVAQCTGGSCPTGATAISTGTGVPNVERVTLGNTSYGDFDFGLVGLGNGKWLDSFADNRNATQPFIDNSDYLAGTRFPPSTGDKVVCTDAGQCPSDICTAGTCANAPGIYSQIYATTFSSSQP